MIVADLRNFALALAAAVVLSALADGARAAEPAEAEPREALNEALWTGPLLAASASTLPQGHVYFEPYLYDVVSYARFDARGVEHGAPKAETYGSQSYINYGLTDRFTVGLIPRFGYASPAAGRSSSHVAFGDLTLQGQYALTRFHEGRWLPALAVNIGETLPTGRYDRLDRPSDGFGSGAYTTTLSLYSQTYFRAPNGRILRARLDLSYAMSSSVKLTDASIYGTDAGFHGRAGAAHSAFGDLAFEYSATRNWVLALDLWYERDGAVQVSGVRQAGQGPPIPVRSRVAPARVFFAAPAVEYNWNDNVGVIVGARLTPAGRNQTASVTPVVALSLLY